MNVLLVGYRGSGKSTVARLAALRLGWTWIDLDVQIELAAGKSIAAIFSDEGEAAFRDRETAALERLLGQDQLLVALGGGAIEREVNRRQLKSLGSVVYLTADPRTLAERIAADATTVSRRPNLTASGGFEEIAAVLTRRDPLYRQCADVVVDTEGKTAQAVADELLRRLHLAPERSDSTGSGPAHGTSQ